MGVAKKKKSALPKVLLTLFVVVILVVIVAEIGLRFTIGKQLKDDFQSQAAAQGITATEEPSISFGASPILLGILSGKINEVTVDTPDTLQISDQNGVPTITGTPESTVELKGLAIRDTENPVADNLILTTFAPDEFILATVQQQMAESMGTDQSGGLAAQLVQDFVKITNITSNPDTDTIEVEFTDGAARATLRPSVVNDQLSFEITDSQLFGFGLPDQVSQALTDGLKSSIQEASGGLHIQNIDVADGGINVTLTGENININNLENVQ